MVPYPESFPLDALRLFKDKLTGGSVDASKLTHASWNVVGYGLSIGLPLTTVQPIGASPDEDAEDLKTINEALEAPPEAIGFPVALVALALKLALKFLL